MRFVATNSVALSSAHDHQCSASQPQTLPCDDRQNQIDLEMSFDSASRAWTKMSGPAVGCKKWKYIKTREHIMASELFSRDSCFCFIKDLPFKIYEYQTAIIRWNKSKPGTRRGNECLNERQFLNKSGMVHMGREGPAPFLPPSERPQFKSKMVCPNSGRTRSTLN